MQRWVWARTGVLQPSEFQCVGSGQEGWQASPQRSVLRARAEGGADPWSATELTTPPSDVLTPLSYLTHGRREGSMAGSASARHAGRTRVYPSCRRTRSRANLAGSLCLIGVARAETNPVASLPGLLGRRCQGCRGGELPTEGRRDTVSSVELEVDIPLHRPSAWVRLGALGRLSKQSLVAGQRRAARTWARVWTTLCALWGGRFWVAPVGRAQSNARVV